jgi:CRISPR-associated protein Cst2
MARQDGDSVPYSKEEYSAIMKGMFSLDLEQAGTFATYNKTGFKNLTDQLKEEALKNGASELDDSFVKDAKGRPQKLIRIDGKERKKRIKETISALKTISGGAMQTNNMADVTPKFIVLATTNTGNHPFSHIVKNDGVNNDKALLNIEGLKEVLTDYEAQFQGKIFIGKRSGFMDEYNKELKELTKEFENVKLLSVNQAIDDYCKQLESQIE